MSNAEAAKVLFAETRDWREDPSDPDQMRVPRRVLARAIRASDGTGFGPGLEPSVADLGNPATFATWQDCFAAVAEVWAEPDKADCKLGYVVSQIPPQQDTSFLKTVPALSGTAPSQEYGPFRLSTGGAAYKVYMFDGVEGVGPGLFPARGAAKAGPGAPSRFRHAWPAALAIFLCVALMGGVAYAAYWRGVSATATAIRPSGLASRLADIIEGADPRLSDEARRVSDAVVKQAKLIPEDRAAWWQRVDVSAGVTPRPAATAAQSDGLAKLVKTATISQVAEVLKPASMNADVLSDIQLRAGDAVDHAFRTDPIAIRLQVSLGGPWLGAICSLIVMAGIVGMAFWGSVLGALIDSRNRLSLSRLQLLAWTILILSLFGVTSPFLIGASEGVVSLPQYLGKSGLCSVLRSEHRHSAGLSSSAKVLRRRRPMQSVSSAMIPVRPMLDGWR